MSDLITQRSRLCNTSQITRWSVLNYTVVLHNDPKRRSRRMKPVVSKDLVGAFVGLCWLEYRVIEGKKVACWNVHMLILFILGLGIVLLLF
ncbi:hypothetical protein LB506_011017 [Fusarium annulatum]|nr:hypothetical protein LB506_011017 [Fusarium annulatum]